MPPLFLAANFLFFLRVGFITWFFVFFFSFCGGYFNDGVKNAPYLSFLLWIIVHPKNPFFSPSLSTFSCHPPNTQQEHRMVRVLTCVDEHHFYLWNYYYHHHLDVENAISMKCVVVYGCERKGWPSLKAMKVTSLLSINGGPFYTFICISLLYTIFMSEEKSLFWPTWMHPVSSVSEGHGSCHMGWY